MVDLEVTNRGETEQKFISKYFEQVSFAWSNASTGEFLEYFGDVRHGARLQPGETQPIRLVFQNPVITYASRADWEASRLEDLSLRLSEYPVEKLAHLQ